MLRTWRQQTCALLVFLSAMAAIAWSIRATPQKVAKLMEDRQHSSRHSGNGLEYWECRDGERDWDYICSVRYEPSASNTRPGAKIEVRKVGVKVGLGYYKNSGMPTSVLPDEGPILSATELSAYRKEEALRRNAAIKAKNNWSDEPAPARDPSRELPFRR
jgi:hypothetical protein